MIVETRHGTTIVSLLIEPPATPRAKLVSRADFGCDSSDWDAIWYEFCFCVERYHQPRRSRTGMRGPLGLSCPASVALTFFVVCLSDHAASGSVSPSKHVLSDAAVSRHTQVTMAAHTYLRLTLCHPGCPARNRGVVFFCPHGCRISFCPLCQQCAVYHDCTVRRA